MEAWVTLVTNDSYALGALTLAASLKRVNTTKRLAIMITSDTVSEDIQKTLKEVFDDVISVEAMDSGDLANLTLLERTELGVTFTKVTSEDFAGLKQEQFQLKKCWITYKKGMVKNGCHANDRICSDV